MVYQQPKKMWTACSVWAEAAQRQGDYCEAENLYLRALDLIEQHGGAAAGEIADILYRLADVYHAQKRHEKIQALYLRAVQIYASLLDTGKGDIDIRHFTTVCRSLEKAVSYTF